MMTKKSYNYLFYSLLTLLVVVLLFVSNTLSISYKEALNVYVNTSVLSYITKMSLYIFGQNDITLRFPFMLFYLLSVLLMYKITDDYFKKEQDRFISILVFMLLPGVLGASLLVNSAIIVTFFTLLYLYYYQTYNKHSYILLCLFLFIDNSFAILFLAIFFFSLKDKTKDIKIIVFSLVLFTLSMYIYGFTTEGKPRSYFLDTFAIYATVFSPLLFIYFVYSLYRSGIRNNRTFAWYISVTALLISLVFSFRQRIYIEDFAPYVVISLPFMLKMFYHSYRIRLKRFRKRHNIAVAFVLVMLFFNILLTIINKPLYLFLPNIKKHFAYKHHFIKELAEELKAKNINEIYTTDHTLELRLKYYGINKGYKYFISTKPQEIFADKIIINYYGKDLLTFYIQKL